MKQICLSDELWHKYIKYLSSFDVVRGHRFHEFAEILMIHGIIEDYDDSNDEQIYWMNMSDEQYTRMMLSI